MKIILNFIIVFTLICLIVCKEDTSPLITIHSEFSSGDDSGISDSIRSLYKSDAAYLAFRHIYANKLADTSLVNISQDLIDSFYDGLIHIYNCKSISSIDTITKIHPVHTYPYQSLYRLIVGFDTSYAWTKQWQDGVMITGNDSIDGLVAEYELELSGKASYGFVALITKIPLNMWALSKVFNKVRGVKSAQPNFAIGSGNNIIASLHSNHTEYTFTIGWGDCPSGCLSRRFWDYIVTSSGQVKYLGSYGDSFPYIR